MEFDPDKWYKNRIEIACECGERQETVYEMVTAEDGLGFGLAVADIKQSVPHRHRQTKETYILISGRLQVTILATAHVLNQPGQKLEIPVGQPHWAAAAWTEEPARVLVISEPAWRLEDHILEYEPGMTCRIVTEEE